MTEDSALFQQHIPQHKTGENTPQCLHCGLCFTSVLSLNRHLFIVHKVKDPEEEQEAAAGVREKEQDNQPVKSTESEVKESVAGPNETEASRVEEAAASLRRDQTSGP